MAVALVHQCLREHTEETFDVRLTHQQIERELDDVGLDFCDAHRALTLGAFANQRGAKYFGIG